MGKLQTLTNGIIKENPVLVLVLGTCPTLAVSTQASNAFGMGVAATAVLLGSNIVISLLRNVISEKVRIPCYIVTIATFVTLVQMVLNAYAYDIYKALGIYLPLIVVNCIILGRAEAFANKHSVLDSTLDAIGMGIGFTLTLLLMATIRETFGAGTWAGIPIPVLIDHPISIFTMAPGGFAVYGLLIAIVIKLTSGKAPRRKSFDCEACPSAAFCGRGSCDDLDLSKKEVAAE